MLKRLVFAAFLAFAPATVQASGGAADTLKLIHLDPSFRQDLRERGYTGARFEIMIEQTRNLFGDTVIVGALERRISAELRARNYVTDDQFFDRLDLALAEAFEAGFTQLSAGERQLLFEVDSGFLRAMPPRDCTQMMAGKMGLGRHNALFDAYLIKLSPNVLDGYYTATRRALRLGFGQRGRARFLTEAQIAQAEAVLFPAVDRMIAQQSNARALQAAWGRGDVAGRYACTFSQMMSAAAMGLADGRRDLALRYLMTSDP